MKVHFYAGGDGFVCEACAAVSCENGAEAGGGFRCDFYFDAA